MKQDYKNARAIPARPLTKKTSSPTSGAQHFKNEPRRQKTPSVVVIGAGVAGLTAASHLFEYGIRNVTVLEATNRPGGRIHSCWMGDMIAEMGAHPLRNQQSLNSIYTMAAHDSIFSMSSQDKYEQKIFNSENVHVNGFEVDWHVIVQAYSIFRKIEQEITSLVKFNSKRSQPDFQKLYAMRFQQELKAFPQDQRLDALQILYGLSSMFRYRCGEDLLIIIADLMRHYREIPGTEHISFLGFVGDLAPVLRNFPENTIQYNKPVEQILWGTTSQLDDGQSSFPPRAIVKCNDGDRYECDYVIVTMSVGVLKKNAEKLFCPGLPAPKTRAIERLGYGHENKIFLEYELPFWLGHDFKTITINWNKKELKKSNSWIKSVSRIEQMPGSCHVICAQISGPDAAQMEQSTELEVVEGCRKILQKLMKNPNIPYPSSILRSKWSSDPYFCGAYSYLDTQSTIVHQSDLAAPLPEESNDVKPIILFAGEATCAGYQSTVEGARLSGIREAERIIQMMKRQMGPSLPPEEVAC